MFRALFLKRINNALNDGYFKTNDFDVSPVEETNRVEITYRFRREFKFNFEFDGGRFECVRSPGTILVQSERRCDNSDELGSEIVNWTMAIRNELSSEPLNRELERQKVQIDLLIKQFSEQPDEPFSLAEVNFVRNGLSELEEQLTVHRKEQADQNTEVAESISSLKEDFETLRSQLETLNKPGWVRSLAVRATTWLRDPENRKLLKDGTAIAKGLLTNEPIEPVTSDTSE